MNILFGVVVALAVFTGLSTIAALINKAPMGDRLIWAICCTIFSGIAAGMVY